MTGKTVAVVGATGLVGTEMLRTLEARNFPVERLVPVASARSAGKSVNFRGASHPVQVIGEEAFAGVDIALFSAGGGTSKEWAPIAARQGAVVIDNSSAWRMDPEVPLCVPEVNPDAIAKRPKGIIANPNCSTIQMLVALAPLHREANIRRIVVSTYQAVSGAGVKALSALAAQRRELCEDGGVPKAGREELGGQLAGNLLMAWSVDKDSLYQEEELKMVFETKKILGDESIRVTPTAVRIPVATGHAESIAIETERPLAADRARALLREAPGVELRCDFANGVYPTPIDAAGHDPVYVGRVREDIGNPGGLQLFVVADNLRKGAALNAVQVAELLLARQP